MGYQGVLKSYRPRMLKNERIRKDQKVANPDTEQSKI
jgi:hypothetical protein